jgi:exonuclease VII small subunit
VYKPTHPGIGLSEPTERPSEGPQPGATQPRVEPTPPQTSDPSSTEPEANTRTEKALAELRRAVESVASCLETLQSANRALNAEVGELRETPDRRATTGGDAEQKIAALEQALDESRQATLLERERAANERAQIFERQDEFLAALLEERESEAEKATTPPTRGSADTDELDRLRGLLEETQLKVSRLEAERERSREVLRRLQQQRDEAQQTITRLTQENRKQTRSPRTDAKPSPAAHGRKGIKSKRPPEPTPPSEKAAAEPQPHEDGAPSAARTGPQSPLAAALANSDPSRRQLRRPKR